MSRYTRVIIFRSNINDDSQIRNPLFHCYILSAILMPITYRAKGFKFLSWLRYFLTLDMKTSILRITKNASFLHTFSHQLFFSVGLSIYMVARFVVPKFQLRRDRLWIVILFSSVVFALIHLNVNTSQSNVLAYFLLLAPYFVSAYLFAYARLTMGLGYAIIKHTIYCKDEYSLFKLHF